MKKIYIVLARRWGEDETHSYLCGWSEDVEKAKDVAEKEADYRGGKYVCVVYETFEGWSEDCPEEVYRTKGYKRQGQ